jgi:arsenite methyltransferase
MSHAAIAALFDDWARRGRAEGMEESHSGVVRAVLGRLGVRPGQQILDLGCGNGWATRALAQAAPGAAAVGVDVSAAMIARAEELHSNRIRARYEVCPFEALDFPDRRFDRAFSMEALYYATDLERALAEVHRVLKPGAPCDVVIDCYAERESTRAWGEALGLDLHCLTTDEWRRRFEAAGFGELALERVTDPRGPGDPERFEPTAHHADWPARVAYHEAGSLWIHALRPR